ncbi:hypothetical protein [Pedobacter antarcticus]|uniref:hypothetical protein n=1 Tax=Pedobacter antarcticus TaxID=34086 RepID=UPI0029307189|nr:hypothetical protein [Pedobacter antarcticus]
MKTTNIPEFAELCHKVAINKLHIKYVDEIQSFCNACEGQPELDSSRIKAKNLMSLVYVNNGLSEKSLEVDLESMSQFSDEMLSRYYSTISGAIITSTDLGRMDEVRPFAFRFLISKNTNNWSTLLKVLVWYIKHYPDTPEITNEFKGVFYSISSTMGYLPDLSASLTDQVRSLSEENMRNDKNLNPFSQIYMETAKENQKQVLSDYLSKNPLFVFREFAFDMVKMKKLAPKNERF